MHGLILGGLKTKAMGRATGAHRIATWLRQKLWDIEVLDFVSSWSNDQLLEYFKSRIRPDTVFVSYSFVFHTWEDRFHEVFSWIRSTHPNIKIIVGGQATEICPIEADYYVNGYGEHAIVNVLNHILGNSTEKLRYTLHRKGKLVRAMHDYPAYPLSNFDPTIVYEDRDFINPKETLVIETARGCKFKCSYCTYPILGVKGDVSRSAEGYTDNLQSLYDKWGVTNFQLADETFNDATQKIEKFANATAKLSFQPNLTGFIRADLLVSKKEDWPLLRGMGFWSHWYGVESFNWESAKSIGKGMHPDKIKQGLLDAKKYFQSTGHYKGTTSMIVGLPGETEETVRNAWAWFKENWKGQSAIYYALYIPKADATEETSSFSANWREKGYSEMTEPVTFEPKYTGKSSAGTYFYEGLKTGLIWKNQNFDFQTAHSMVDEFYSWYGDYFGAHAFNLNDIHIGFNSIDEWVNKTYSQGIRQTANIAGHKFITEYIDSKLNWRP
jgi:hypothetical protein